MVGPGIVIDKKTKKKMKKAHKKPHKHHKHGKVSVLWSLAGEGAPFRGTGVIRSWGWPFSVCGAREEDGNPVLLADAGGFPLRKGILLKGV